LPRVSYAAFLMGEGQHRPVRRYADGPVVGLTGARFGGTVGRRLRSAGSRVEGHSLPPVNHIDPADQGYSPSVPPATERGHGEVTPDTSRSVRADKAGWDVDDADRDGEAAWDGLEQAFDLVRPYSWTGGRTTCSQELAVETLVSATGREPHPKISPEHQAILGLCQTPRSVAEVAALLSVPLGVARVVLGDMAEAGSVVVHATASSATGAPDFALMQRVLSCLQRL